MNAITRNEEFFATHHREGWCGDCGTTRITPRPSGHKNLWFCVNCGRFLGEEPARPKPRGKGSRSQAPLRVSARAAA